MKPAQLFENVAKQLGISDEALEHLANTIRERDISHLSRVASKVLLDYPFQIVEIILQTDGTCKQSIKRMQEKSYKILLDPPPLETGRVQAVRAKIGLFKVHNSTTRPCDAEWTRKRAGLGPVHLEHFLTLCEQRPDFVRDGRMIVMPEPMPWYVPFNRIATAHYYREENQIKVFNEAYSYTLFKGSYFVGLIDEQPL